MPFWTLIRTAFKSLTSNKMRSFLAMLGIVIGVAAVISMLALGAGAQQQILSRMSAMGTRLLVVRPGSSGFRGVMSGTSSTLTLKDADAILETVDGLTQVAPVVRGSNQAKYLNKNTRTSIIGTSITYFPIRDLKVESGRTFTDDECDRLARVAVLGPTTAEALFGDADPVGATIKIKGINVRVVGVLKAKGDQGFANPDDQILLPFTFAMQQLLGQDYLGEIDLQATEDADLDQVIAKTTALLHKRHRIQPGDEDDFSIRNQADMIATATDMAQTFTILLGAIASISLLVGGIGIMNVMLVTVTERTREIGVRKAIGARNRDILRQFLIESITMSGVGGALGAALGIGLARGIEAATAFATVVTTSSIVLSIGFSALVGIFFGYYPARRAASLDPIESLRYE